MFYDNSDPEFPNWWTNLDEGADQDPSESVPTPSGRSSSEPPEPDPGQLIAAGNFREALEQIEGERESERDGVEYVADCESPGSSFSPRVGEGDGPFRFPRDHRPRGSRSRSEEFDVGRETIGTAYSAAVAPTRRIESRDLVLAAWQNAEVVPGNDAELWRKDEFGNWIHRLDYGRSGSEFGWEIFDPGLGRRSQGIYLMRPMQWRSFLRQYEIFGSA